MVVEMREKTAAFCSSGSASAGRIGASLLIRESQIAEENVRDWLAAGRDTRCSA